MSTKRYCYIVSWQRETRLGKQLVKVEGLGRWLSVWIEDFKQDHIGELVVKGWAAKFFDVPFNEVQVLRMSHLDRIN